MMLMVDTTITSVALPSIQRELGATASQLAWVQNAYLLAVAALMPFAGSFGDRYGRKRVFVAGLVLFTVGSAASGLAPDIAWLIAARTLQGSGAAVVSALGLSILAASFGVEHLERPLGIWAASTSLGVAAGPLLGGILVAAVDWRAIYTINIPIGIATALVMAALVPESRSDRRTTVDAFGATLLAGALLSVVAGLHALTLGTTDYSPVHSLVPLALAVVLTAAFVARERRAHDPVMPLSLFRPRAFRAAVVVSVVVNFALMGSMYFQSLVLQNLRGWTPLSTGLLLLPLNIALAISGLRAASVIKRFGNDVVAAGGLALAALGLAVLVPLGFVTGPALVIVIGAGGALLGLGLGSAFPSISAAGIRQVDLGEMGVASATLGDARQVGSTLGIAALVAVMIAVSTSTWTRLGDDLGLPSTSLSAVQNDVLVGSAPAVAGRLGAEAAAAASRSFAVGVAVAYVLAFLLVAVAAVYARRSLRPSPAPDPASSPAGGG
ncbi:MAG: MFS transporter [Acidimicrobiales bacterium]